MKAVVLKQNLVSVKNLSSIHLPSFEQVNEIPSREIVTFTDESERIFKIRMEFLDNSELVNINISGTASV